jgi:hypothetical protein
MYSTRYFIIGLLGIWACMLACQQQKDLCLQPQNVQAQISIKGGDADSAYSITIPYLQAHVLVNNEEKLLLEGQFQVSSASLSLSPLADTTTWIVSFDSTMTIRDTFTLTYQRQPHFVSNGCGYTYFFNLDTVWATQHIIKSLKLDNKFVSNNVNETHITLYIP